MKYCSSCGAQLPDNSRYCPTCGARCFDNSTNYYVKEKDPILAIILSFLIVGLGHVYVGKILKGICLFIGCIVATAVLVTIGLAIATSVPVVGWFIFSIGCVASLIIWLYAMYDVNELAKEYNRCMCENGSKPW